MNYDLEERTIVCLKPLPKSLRGVSDEAIYFKIATLLLVARNDNFRSFQVGDHKITLSTIGPHDVGLGNK